MRVTTEDAVAGMKEFYSDPIVWVVVVAGYSIAYFIDLLLGMIAVAGLLTFYLLTTRHEDDE